MPGMHVKVERDGRQTNMAAQHSIQKLATSKVDLSLKLSFFRETLRLEGEAKNGEKPNIIECFRGTELRRLAICVMAYAIQVLVGSSVDQRRRKRTFEELDHVFVAGLPSRNLRRLRCRLGKWDNRSG